MTEYTGRASRYCCVSALIALVLVLFSAPAAASFIVNFQFEPTPIDPAYDTLPFSSGSFQITADDCTPTACKYLAYVMTGLSPDSYGELGGLSPSVMPLPQTVEDNGNIIKNDNGDIVTESSVIKMQSVTINDPDDPRRFTIDFSSVVDNVSGSADAIHNSIYSYEADLQGPLSFTLVGDTLVANSPSTTFFFFNESLTVDNVVQSSLGGQYRLTSMTINEMPTEPTDTFRPVFDTGGFPGSVLVQDPYSIPGITYDQDSSPFAMGAAFVPQGNLSLSDAAAQSASIGESFVSFNWLQTIQQYGYVDQAGVFHDRPDIFAQYWGSDLPTFDPVHGDEYPMYLQLSGLSDAAHDNVQLSLESALYFYDAPWISDPIFGLVPDAQAWQIYFLTQLVAVRADGSYVPISDLYPDLFTDFRWKYTQTEPCHSGPIQPDGSICGISGAFANVGPLHGDGIVEFLGFGSHASAVPEPSTWGMLILGFAAAGVAMRGRRRSPVSGPALAKQ